MPPKTGFDKTRCFKNEREAARAKINRDIEFKAVASDIDETAVALTLENAKKAGVGEFVSAVQSDISDFDPKTERGIVVTNPPYGERLLDIDEARRIYGVMGKVFEKKHGYRYSVISPDEKFEQLFGDLPTKSASFTTVCSNAICICILNRQHTTAFSAVLVPTANKSFAGRTTVMTAEARNRHKNSISTIIAPERVLKDSFGSFFVKSLVSSRQTTRFESFFKKFLENY